MKLCRFGPKGHEKPGLIDGLGALRSLAGHRPDLTTADLTATGLAELRFKWRKKDIYLCKVF